MESTQARRSAAIAIPKILLTGATGQVGYELQRSLLSLGKVICVERSQMDLSNLDSIRKCVSEIQPDLIVNPAAYTAVDKAESEPELAMAINGIAPGILAEAAKDIGAAMIHFSTDYVFDGNLDRPYLESDHPNPLSVYGKTKLAGEQAIVASGIPHLIFRTSWVYGQTGKNFMLTMLRLAREKPELKIVSDQFGAPTWSRLIAQVSADILNRLIWQAQVDQESLNLVMGSYGGIYHLTAAGDTNWYEFAKAIFASDPRASQQILTQVQPISAAAYPTPATRPANSRLDHGKLEATFGLCLPHWQAGLESAIAV